MKEKRGRTLEADGAAPANKWGHETTPFKNSEDFRMSVRR